MSVIFTSQINSEDKGIVFMFYVYSNKPGTAQVGAISKAQK